MNDYILSSYSTIFLRAVRGGCLFPYMWTLGDGVSGSQNEPLTPSPRVHFKLSDHDKKEQCKCAAGYDPRCDVDPNDTFHSPEQGQDEPDG